MSEIFLKSNGMLFFLANIYTERHGCEKRSKYNSKGILTGCSWTKWLRFGNSEMNYVFDSSYHTSEGLQVNTHKLGPMY